MGKDPKSFTLTRMDRSLIGEYAGESLREAVERAAKDGANLRGANLWGADLREANLREANLMGANLREANLMGANLRGADLMGANLREADLMGANLWEADLKGANLWGADLREANLMGAYLWGANLMGAYLWGANLGGADLGGANLMGAYLWGANLGGADLGGANLMGAYLWGANLGGAKNIPVITLAQTSIIPETGAFEGWKKCRHGRIVRVLIPADAKRSNSTGRKCRAERVEVLEVIGSDDAQSGYDEKTRYRVGETVSCDKWNEDRWTECGGGIHFFITRAEAEDYEL